MLFWLLPRDGLPSLDVTARGQSLSKAEGRKGSYHCAFQASSAQSSPSPKDELVKKKKTKRTWDHDTEPVSHHSRPLKTGRPFPEVPLK